MEAELSDGRIVVRPYGPDDLDALYQGTCESIPEVSTWLDWCHPDYRREEAEQAKQVVRFLFRHYLSRPEEIDSDFVTASDPPWRRVADYVAGMTDGFALTTAERLGHGV